MSVRSLAAWIAPADWRSATCAAEMTSGDVEKRFVNFTRTCEPPIVVQAISRSVWLLIWLGTVACTVVTSVVTVVESGSRSHAVVHVSTGAASDGSARSVAQTPEPNSAQAPSISDRSAPRSNERQLCDMLTCPRGAALGLRAGYLRPVPQLLDGPRTRNVRARPRIRIARSRGSAP